MKKILLLSHYFQPCTLTPAQRITYWAQNFHKLGYYPVVVTRVWNPEIRMHHDTKLPFGNEVKIEKFPTHEVHYLPFRPGMLDWSYLHFGETWLRPLFLSIRLLDVVFVGFSLHFTSFANYLPYLKGLLRNQHFDKMIISGEPFYLFRLGFSLHRRFGISWMADYRDDWSTNELQMEKGGSGVRKWVAKLESNFEKKWVGTADSIISVSEPYTKRICDFLNKPGITIQNGFEESLLDLPEVGPYDQFTVTYSGVLYPSQDISMILEVLDRCHRLNQPFRLLFLGAGFDVKEKKRIEAKVPEHLKPWVEITDRYPRSQALEMLQKSHVFLGIAYGKMKGIPSSKLYEYIALGKPVLLCPTDQDLMEEILTESGLGFFAMNSSDGKELLLELQNLYREVEQLSKMKANSRRTILRYSRFEQLKKLAEHIG
ncbi:glycosyltransferase family protein [Algoriphagus boritolerans]|uniref:glycosyltransferase n=1 Tax=Algoriphagus boritolerans TaxID=308111 RepID=UPI000CDEBFFD|nr:glycosyltransferase [Algoriphagus boritolerans]